MPLKVINEQKYKINKDRLASIYAIYLSEAKIKPESIINLILVNDSYIRQLNKQYRQKDSVTDVLSFEYDENCKDQQIKNVQSILGEIFISYSQAKKQAILYDHSIQQEIEFLMVHGLLHLAGFEHGNKAQKKLMENMAAKILKDYYKLNNLNK